MHLIQASSRGQITIPKKLRDQLATDYFELIFQDGALVLKPIYKNSFLEKLQQGMEDFREGRVTPMDQVMKEYGL